MALRKNKLVRRIITFGLILLVLGIILYPRLKPMLTSEPGEGPIAVSRSSGLRGGGQPLLATGYVIVPTQMHELIYSTGSLIPDEEVELSFETSGKVVGIYFSEGARVQKGELLAKINDKPLQAQLLKLQAQRKLMEEREFRQRQLLDRDAISQESYDQVSTELQSLDADIKLVEARISETELRAPFDGIVGLRFISEGAFATTQTRIVQLVRISPLKVEFSVPERYSGEIAQGFTITFILDGDTNTYRATVYAVAPQVDLATRTIVARALYPNRNEELKPGRFASVRARLSEIEDAVSIPSEALIPEMEGEKVFIYKNGKAAEVQVTTGLRTESNIQIRSGLQFGDTLLITAILQLRHNIPVQMDTLITNQPAERAEL
jgi:membrane fusion protein (multidrug efflux system)